MDAEDLIPLLDQLDDNIDDLEEVLKPLLDQPLSHTSNKLPVLDKAKLHVWTTYALESLLFSYLRLQGVKAKEHPVFRELTRVRQYFDKIEALEKEPEKRTLTLDKAAAGRFIKHGLAGNDKIDLERAEREAKEKAVAQLKAAMLAKKSAESEKPSDKSKKHSTSTSSEAKSDSDSDNNGDSDDEEGTMAVYSAPAAQSEELAQPRKLKKKQSKERHESAKAAKQQRKLDKQERHGSKKERRQKKKEARKARKEK